MAKAETDMVELLLRERTYTPSLAWATEMLGGSEARSNLNSAEVTSLERTEMVHACPKFLVGW